MKVFQTEGIILQTLRFKEYDLILTLFTPLGIQKIFSKGSKRYNPLTTALTRGEFLYSLGKNDLHRLQDGTILNQHLELRERLESLQAAEKLIQAIFRSQWPGKQAPKLYSLFRVFLETLAKAPSPERVATTFYLKVMKHEGILQLEESTLFRFAGECVTKENSTSAVEFTEEEEKLLQRLALSRSLEEVFHLNHPKDFGGKIETLFNQAFSKL